MFEERELSENPTVPIAPESGEARPGARGGAGGPLPKIGSYRVLAHLGEGGFGSVYLAEQTHPVRRRVAIKILKVGMDTPSLIARFEAERQVLVMMDHPGVAKVFDAGVTPEGRPYVAMEYVPGEPISRFCESAQLSVDDRVRLMVRVCNAVHHAHMKGVIHRDLKPGNILVELVDGKPAPRVIDFGVAKALDRSLSDSKVVTELGQMVGTPEYMPPEQARGSAADVDTRADVYALGAVLYELLAGVTPLDSRELRRAGYAEMQRMIEQQAPVLPSQRLTGIRSRTGSAPAGESVARIRRISRELDWIVMRCLEKDRTRRYESAAALARDLERYLHDEPVEAGPPSLRYRASKFIRRNKIAVGAAVFCVLVGAGALGVTSWALARALEDRSRAESRELDAVHARDEAESVTKFLTGILESAQPENEGRDVTVRQVLDAAARNLEGAKGAGAGPSLLRARLHTTLGTSYLALGSLPEAERHLTAGLELRMRELGPGAPLTLRSQFNLGGLLFAQGRYGEAKELYTRCLNEWRRLGAAPEQEVLGAMNNLAQIALEEGKLDEAAALQRETVARMEGELGSSHEHTLGARINLGSMLRQMGEFAESERMLRDTEEAWRTAYGEEHPGTLLAMHNLVLLYLDARRLVEAEAVGRRLVEARTRVLGEAHPDTLGAMSNLALVLSRTGSPEAERLYLRAWEGARETLGETHRTTYTTALNLLNLYEAAGWPAESAGTVERVVRTMRQVAARADASASELNSCAWLLLTVEPESLRDASAALEAAVRACEVERGAGGHELWQYLDTLALAHARTGAMEKAVEAQREAISRIPPTPSARQYEGEMKERLAQYEREAGKQKRVSESRGRP